MNVKEFIKKYVLVKSNNKWEHIKLKDYQIKFLEWYEQTKK